MEKNPLSTTVPTTIAKRHLPALLQFASGEAVISPWQWPARHAEILELFRAQVFGRNPVERPAALQFRLESSVPNALGGAATLKRVAIEFSGTYGSGKITLSLYVPNSRAGAAPTFLLISHRDSHRGAVLAEPETQAQLDNDPFQPIAAIIARGYGAAAFAAQDVDPDWDDDFRNGAHGVLDAPRDAGQIRSGDAWGTLAAWAWGASRVLDYLETDDSVDARRVAVVGHSRGGIFSLRVLSPLFGLSQVPVVNEPVESDLKPVE